MGIISTWSRVSPNCISRTDSELRQILSSYFYWTYPRGVFHYDVMVTLILLFIFITPHLWDYGAKPSLRRLRASVPGRRQRPRSHHHRAGLRCQCRAGASDSEVKKALRKAIEPVTGDDVFVEKWATATDAQGNLTWKVWAHR